MNPNDILANAPKFTGFPDIGDQQGAEKMSAPAPESNIGGLGQIEQPKELGPEAKEVPSIQIEEVNTLTAAIRSMNKYAQLVREDIPSAKAARAVISVLGELLKTEHYQMQQKNQAI